VHRQRSTCIVTSERILVVFTVPKYILKMYDCCVNKTETQCRERALSAVAASGVWPLLWNTWRLIYRVSPISMSV